MTLIAAVNTRKGIVVAADSRSTWLIRGETQVKTEDGIQKLHYHQPSGTIYVLTGFTDFVEPSGKLAPFSVWDVYTPFMEEHGSIELTHNFLNRLAKLLLKSVKKHVKLAQTGDLFRATLFQYNPITQNSIIGTIAIASDHFRKPQLTDVDLKVKHRGDNTVEVFGETDWFNSHLYSGKVQELLTTKLKKLLMKSRDTIPYSMENGASVAYGLVKIATRLNKKLNNSLTQIGGPVNVMATCGPGQVKNIKAGVDF